MGSVRRGREQQEAGQEAGGETLRAEANEESKSHTL